MSARHLLWLVRGANGLLRLLPLLGAGALGLLGAGALGGCDLHQEGVRPPDNRIFFPGGAAIEGGGDGIAKWLYVVNSNSDLRYSAGTVIALDLQTIRGDFESAKPGDWKDCTSDTRYVPPADVGPADRCCWDYLDPQILDCDEQIYVRRESSVRIGSFGGRPVMQQLPAPEVDPAAPPTPGRRRMFVPVRGDVSIDMLEVAATTDSVRFLCTGSRAQPDQAQSPFAVCDPEWSINREGDPSVTPDVPDSEIVHLPDEPYALAVDEDRELLYAGHLSGGGVSLIDLGCGVDVRTPALVQVYPGLIPANVNGSQGITSLTIRTNPGFDSGPVYASSRYSPLVGSFSVYGVDQPCDGTRSPVIVGTGQFLSTGLGGAETRGIEFVSAGRDSSGNLAAAERAFILQRTPPALVAIDTATQLPFATIEVCQSPTNLVQQTDDSGRTLALFVTCFDAGEVYVIDPWAPRVRTVIPVGRGPVATILPPRGAAAADSLRAYVVGFSANDIAIIDLDSRPRPSGRDQDVSVMTQYRVIQRIGFSSPTPREVGPQ